MKTKKSRLPQPNLYLVGFMGTGKSTHGRALARRLGYRFFDSDQEIEKSQKRPIKTIFAEEGEPYFRKLEQTFIEEGHPPEGCVVSCGGGLVAREGMPEVLQRKGVVIALVASPECILARTSQNPDRPLLQVPDPDQKIRDLLAEREPYYRQAGILVLTDHRRMKEIQNHILRIYRRKQKEWR
ncbi:MAG: shikimate kinase [Opitutales bacterium]|nr:shikimate kinase [Opitutales bacterium]MCH8540630.1 shikimate kinase [Opitutales bacterium]